MTDAPRRIQLSRARGWRMPENTVSVARPGPLGNPYPVTDDRPAHRAVAAFCDHLADNPGLQELAMNRLPGKNVACWCGLCDAHKDGKPLGVACSSCPPCHGDALLEFVNRKGSER